LRLHNWKNRRTHVTSWSRSYCGKAAETAARISSGERFWLEAHDDQVLFCHRFDPRLDLGRGEAQILLYSFMRDAIRQVAGPCWSPREITLETPIAGVPDPLGSTVPVRVTGVVSFPIPRHLLRLPMPRILRLARHERTGTAGLQETAPASAFADSLRQLLVSLASTSGLDVRGVAEVANVSVRTLQRRLSRAGVRFRDLQQEAQLAQAIALMQEPALEWRNGGA